MLSCIFIKRRLYDYLDNSLSEIERIKVSRHLKVCSACQKKLNEMTTLIELAKLKNQPQPSEDFWHKFRIELDAKLNTRLVPSFNFKPKLVFRFKPALALSLASMVIITGIYLLFYGRPQSVIKSDSAMVDELDTLDEICPETSLNDEEVFDLDEFFLFEQAS